MRDLIHCLYICLASGLRRALRASCRRARSRWLAPVAPPPPPSVLPLRPPYDRGALPAHVQERRKPLDEDAFRFVRPYLVVHEQNRAAEHVRHIQRERRTAATLASMGIEYDVTLVAI